MINLSLNKKVLNLEVDRGRNMDKFIKEGIKEMNKELNKWKGLAITSNQINFGFPVILINGIKTTIWKLIIPILKWKSFEELNVIEGCLSKRNMEIEVRRRKYILLQISIKGKKIKLFIGGFIGIVIQHEIGHLKGLIIGENDKK